MPDNPPKGGQWADHRRVINAVLFRTRTGIPWRDLPERYGPWETAAGRHRRWCLDGTWQRIADRLRIDAATGEDLVVGIDSTSVRAHSHAAGAAKKGSGTGRSGRLGSTGTFPGGLTTKIHLIADQRRRPLVTATSPGQRGDAPMFEPLMVALHLPRSVGRPRTRPDRLLADKAYSSAAIRSHLSRRGIKATIAQPADQRANRRRRGSAGGRPPAFDRGAYRGRNTVERAINLLKQNRAVATRYDKRAAIYDGTVQLASIRIWLRDLTRSKNTA
ncbi:transposase [Nocardiopsis gilva YIM 90087]|uniref:Transposase n=2 Tax=Nocardiopsis gilva TaxID=280236 RepID=A0A223SD62_9ACTN|nr:IS5 family transposase [Nocardiopsis gilva]ASU86035.1 transposase [Nocardiopsis gilva YIM 90087]